MVPGRTIRFALRSLLRAPRVTLPALFVLVLGLAAATAVFTVVDSIAFRPLPLPDSERLVSLCEDHPRLAGLCIVSPANLRDVARGSSSLAAAGFARGWPYRLTGRAPVRGVRGGLATAGFWEALGIRPAAGRFFRADEIGPGRDDVLLLSHAFWTTRFGGDSAIVGRTIELDGAPQRVVGILPEGLELPFGFTDVEVWKPPHFDPGDADVRGWRGFRGIARLAPGATVRATADELQGRYRGLAEAYPDDVGDPWRLRVAPLRHVAVGSARPVLLAFLAAATLLLLIVCANVANLLLARGVERRREFALRRALGAGRVEIAASVVAEGVLLSLVASAAALLVSPAITHGVLALAPPDIPRVGEVAFDGRVLLFTLGAALGMVLLSACLPAFRISGEGPAHALRGGGYGATSGPRALRSLMLLTELSLAFVLLAGAFLLARSFRAYLRWTPGFEPERLLAVSVLADPADVPDQVARAALWERSVDAVRAVAGVEAAATASAGPLFGGGDGATSFVLEGGGGDGSTGSAWWFDVGPGYFETLGLPVVEGRGFGPGDGPASPPVALVNRAFVRAAGGGPVVGRTVRLPEFQRSLTVVGVVPDVPPPDPGSVTRPEIYWSDRQAGRVGTFFVVRTAGDPQDLAPAVRAALEEVAPRLVVADPFPLTRTARRLLVRPRFQASILGAFAVAATLLTLMGVYAVVSYAVTRRLREMGIRRALGARSTDVSVMVVRSALALAAAGVAVGAGATAALAPSLGSLLHGVAPLDPLSLGGAAATLLVAAAAAALVPARRAGRADPLDIIRSD